jgi:1-acyl-sn-glycerol-3-phosphate acyltransferase
MLKKLNYGWRLFATGLSFFVFGIGGLFTGVIIIPLVMLIPGSDSAKLKRVRGVISFTFKCFFILMHSLRVLRYRIYGQEELKQDKSCLVIANHPSLIDIVSLISIYPNACCIVKKELWHNFFIKKVVSGAGYIPNDDPEALLQSCTESLARGDVLIIFPEGTRTVPGKEMTLQRGAAHIALRLNCPIRTIQIKVEPSTLTKNLPWYEIPDRRVDFTVTAKDILSVREYLDSQVPLSIASRRLTSKMRDNIAVALD